MKNKKILGLVGIIVVAVAVGLIAYFAGKSAGTQGTVITTEAPATETPTTETPTEEPTTEALTEAVTEEEKLDLLAIFNPKEYFNSETGDVIKTDDMYNACSVYGITSDTHYVDDIISYVVTELSFFEDCWDSVTNEQVEETLKIWAVSGRILSDEEFKQMTDDIENSQKETYGIKPASGTKYATTTLNIRAYPDSEAEKYGSLAYAEAIEIVGITEDEKWCQFRMDDGFPAFASAKYLSDTKPEPKPQNNNSNQLGEGDRNPIFDDPFFDGFTQVEPGPYGTFYNEEGSMIYYASGSDEWIRIDPVDGPFH